MVEKSNWDLNAMLPALDTMLEKIKGKMEKIYEADQLPLTIEATELALWKAYLEVEDASDAFTIATNRLNDLRRHYATLRIAVLANAAVATERVPDAGSTQTEGRLPGMSSASGQTL